MLRRAPSRAASAPCAPRAVRLSRAPRRARALHGHLLRGQRKAGAAASAAAIHLRHAHDRTFSSLLYIAYGESAPMNPTPWEVFEFIVRMGTTAKQVLGIWKEINDRMDQFNSLPPVLQALLMAIFFNPLFERIDGLVPTAEECLCPFVGIQGLPFDECPVQEGLLGVISLASECAAHLLIFVGCLGVKAAVDIGKILPKVIEYCTKDENIDKDSKAAEPELNSFYLDLVKDDQASLFDLILFACNVDKDSKATEAEPGAFHVDFIKVNQATLFIFNLSQASGSMAALAEKRLMLKNSGNEEFEVFEWLTIKSRTIKHKILLKVIEDNQVTLFYLILAANYLDIKDLLDLTCQTGADMFKGRLRRYAGPSTSRTTS